MIELALRCYEPKRLSDGKRISDREARFEGQPAEESASSSGVLQRSFPESAKNTLLRLLMDCNVLRWSLTHVALLNSAPESPPLVTADLWDYRCPFARRVAASIGC